MIQLELWAARTQGTRPPKLGDDAMSLKRVRQMFCQLGLMAMLAACQDPVSAERNACPESAQQYWKAFRGAVLQNDLQAVADLTQFPFQLSIGSLDFDRKEVYLSRKEFIAVFPRLLSSDPGYSDAPRTMKEYVKASPRIPIPSKTCAPDGSEFGVGTWVFLLQPGGWRLVQAYAGEDFEL